MSAAKLEPVNDPLFPANLKGWKKCTECRMLSSPDSKVHHTRECSGWVPLPPAKEHESTDELVCPHCGSEQSESYEFFHGNDEDTTASCGECGSEFAASRCVSVTYSSKPLKQKGGAR